MFDTTLQTGRHTLTPRPKTIVPLPLFSSNSLLLSTLLTPPPTVDEREERPWSGPLYIDFVFFCAYF